jgi:hypothetical protein
MIDMAELMKEQQKIAKVEAELGEVEITHKIKAPKHSMHSRPSFFQRMFSTTNMNKITPAMEDYEKDKLKTTEGYVVPVNKDLDLTGLGVDDDDDVGPLEKESDGIISSEMKDINTSEAVDGTSKVQDNASKEMHFYDDEYIDPPMPNIGKPINVDFLEKRVIKAEYALHDLMHVIMADVNLSVKGASSIPVDKALDRISVSDEQYKRIGKVRSVKDIDGAIQSNIQEIQKSLNYRKSALIIMNSNYSHKLIRKIEPIYVNEARTIMDHDIQEASK